MILDKIKVVVFFLNSGAGFHWDTSQVALKSTEEHLEGHFSYCCFNYLQQDKKYYLYVEAR